ncbi:hypothetical protein FHS20_001835 [Phyllobacterium endophyticum]|nr:hypothetical protein [Phyllobacterium endophyticum]
MRLSDFSDWQVLRVTCTRCNNAVLLYPKSICLAARRPLTMTVADLEKKFRCSCCESLGEARIEIGPQPGGWR